MAYTVAGIDVHKHHLCNTPMQLRVAPTEQARRRTAAPRESRERASPRIPPLVDGRA